MNAAQLDRPVDVQPDPALEVKQDIEPLPRRDAASDHPTDHVPEGATTAVEVNAFIEAVSISSAKQVVRLIAELQGVQDLLQNESQRIEREAGRYLHLNDGAFKAAKMMVKSIPQWRR